MRSFLRFLFAALVCLAVAGAGISLLIRINRGERPEAVAPMPGPPPAVALSKPYPSPDLVTFPDPTAPPGSSAQVFLDPQAFDALHPGRDGAVHRQGPRRGLAPRVPRGDRPSRRAGQGAAPGAGPRRLRLGPHADARTRRCRPSGSTAQLAFVALYEGDHDEAAAWLKKALALSEHAGRAGRGPGAHDGPAGHQRPAPGRAGQLHRLRRPVELHLPDRPRGGPHPAGGLARGGPVVHRLPRRVARRPPRPLAAEHRLHDARRVSGQGPAAIT